MVEQSRTHVLLRLTGEYTRELLVPLTPDRLSRAIDYWAHLEDLNIDQAVNIFTPHINAILN